MIWASSASVSFCTSAERKSRAFSFSPMTVFPAPSGPWQTAHFDLYTASPGFGPAAAEAAPRIMLKAIAPTSRLRKFSILIPLPCLHRIAHRQREYISPEIARQGWSGKRLLIVIIIIPSRPVRQVLEEFNLQRGRGQMVVVAQRPGGSIGVEDQRASLSAR